MKAAPRRTGHGVRANQGMAVQNLAGAEKAAPRRKTGPTAVPIIAVRCADCSAEPGHRCTALGGPGSRLPVGTPLTWFHVVRRRMAVRESNRLREAVGTLAPNADLNERPRPLVDPDAEPCPTCGWRIGLTPRGNRKAHTTDGRKPRVTDTTSTYPCGGSGLRP